LGDEGQLYQEDCLFPREERIEQKQEAERGLHKWEKPALTPVWGKTS
jgi:hypothetical protein